MKPAAGGADDTEVRRPAVLESLEPLVAALRRLGHTVVGPVVRDGVIRFAEVDSAADLAAGWTDEQRPGHYRLRRPPDGTNLHETVLNQTDPNQTGPNQTGPNESGGGGLVFGFAAGPDSVKGYTHPPRTTLFRMRDGVVEEVDRPAPRVALLGVRACDLAALTVQDRVFLGGRHPDEAYRRRREALFLVAVTCAVPGGTCFCASTGTGPRAEAGYDLALTELTGPHRFLAEAGSPRGSELLATLPSRPAGAADLVASDEVARTARARMGRTVDLEGVRERLVERRESPVWNEIATRCLTCGNCTMVCPTCFCTTVEDGTDLSDGTAERSERWDSCFSLGFTELGGEPVRASGAARYRQWLTHKFSTWWDQFGTSGCVGCGRCVTWCPTGIDITEELERLR